VTASSTIAAGRAVVRLAKVAQVAHPQAARDFLRAVMARKARVAKGIVRIAIAVVQARPVAAHEGMVGGTIEATGEIVPNAAKRPPLCRILRSHFCPMTKEWNRSRAR
jgi:hypothetical protein